MCVIAFSPSPLNCPTREQLVRACEANPDGFGWALIAGDRLVTHRTMGAIEAVDSYLAAVVVEATGPSLFHARIASHGSVDLGNCHPFPVGGDPDVVLAHNGILDINPGPFDTRSDTAIFVEDVLPHSGIETLDTDPDAWEQWIGPGNKIVVLSISPRLAHSAYLLTESAGVWDNGVWWSNQSYLPRPLLLLDPDAPDGPDDPEEEVWCASCREEVPKIECVKLAGENICLDCAQAIFEPDDVGEPDGPYLSPSPTQRSQW